MKAITPVLLIACTLSLTSAEAQIDGDDTLLAKRGEGTVSHADFEARLNRIPEEHRFTFVRARSRMEDLLNQMLTSSQLAADAEAADFDEVPVIQARMALAAREELASAWLEHTIEQAKPADYEAMAREEYTIERDKYQTPHLVDVSHILVGTEERSDEEALALAQELRAQLIDDPSRFDAFVKAHSDDPSKVNNGGSFTEVREGDMVPAFEKVAFELPVGELSEPVKTQYGYHLIRKDGDHPPRQRSFGEVRLALMQQMRKRHQDRIRAEYLTELYSQEMKVTKESVENGIERVFGPEVLAKYAEENESQ